MRRLNQSDFNNYQELVSNYDIQKAAGLPKINAFDKARRLFQSALRINHTYAITENNFASFIGIFSFYEWIDPKNNVLNPKSRELGFALLPEYQHQGYMTEVIKEICHFLTVSSNLKSLWCGMFKNNVACQKLMDKTHFKFQFCQYSNFFNQEELFYQYVLK